MVLVVRAEDDALAQRGSPGVLAKPVGRGAAGRDRGEAPRGGVEDADRLRVEGRQVAAVADGRATGELSSAERVARRHADRSD